MDFHCGGVCDSIVLFGEQAGQAGAFVGLNRIESTKWDRVM